MKPRYCITEKKPRLVECEAEHKAVLVEKSCGNDMLILLTTIHVIDDGDAGWNVVLERKMSLATNK